MFECKNGKIMYTAVNLALSIKSGVRGDGGGGGAVLALYSQPRLRWLIH